MQFNQIINAALSKENDRPLMQKEIYPVSPNLQQYLQQYHRDVRLPVHYKELLHYRYTNANKDENGRHTHWENVVYDQTLFSHLQEKLISAYCLLTHKTGTYKIAGIDYCEFANSMPFRIVVTDTRRHTQDLFYIKTADASRIYGLELEQLLSPNRTDFLYHENTLIEAHIEGMAGDDFLQRVPGFTAGEKKSLAEEFVRFNERCFARLLGDMRSYNFVVVQTKSKDNSTFRIRAIDFDQQCYEGRLNLYLPQFYKENYEYAQMAMQLLSNAEIEEIQKDEREALAQTAAGHPERLHKLVEGMLHEEISENYKVISLRKELNAYFNTSDFSKCGTMGQIVKQMPLLCKPDAAAE